MLPCSPSLCGRFTVQVVVGGEEGLEEVEEVRPQGHTLTDQIHQHNSTCACCKHTAYPQHSCVLVVHLGWKAEGTAGRHTGYHGPRHVCCILLMLMHARRSADAGGGGGGGGGGGNMLSLRRTRRWKNSNGLVYEEETEVVHMSAGSGGNSSSRMQQLLPSHRRSSHRLGSIQGSNLDAADRAQLEALAAAAVGDVGAGGNRMFWHRGGGGFSWSWRRRRT